MGVDERQAGDSFSNFVLLLIDLFPWVKKYKIYVTPIHPFARKYVKQKIARDVSHTLASPGSNGEAVPRNRVE